MNSGTNFKVRTCLSASAYVAVVVPSSHSTCARSLAMGHHISGVVIPGEIDTHLALQFDAKIVSLRKGFNAIALCGEYVDTWAERLDMRDDVAAMPLFNSRVVRHIATALAGDRPFAFVETDYFGGNGTQWGAAYRGDAELAPLAEGGAGPINAALKAIGVRSFLTDCFTAVGLAEHRDWDDLFEDYFD